MNPVKQLMWLKIGLGETEEYTDPVYTECAKRTVPRRKGQITLTRKYSMMDDDMSHMEDVFLKRQLPFAEYLVECGYHRMSMEMMDKPSGPTSNMMEKYGYHFSAKYEIPCAGGAVFNVSVICGKMFYSSIDGPYEVMGPSVSVHDDSGDPSGYQTEEDLMVYLAKLVSKAKEY
jgi:hypothetical protein